MVAAGGSIPASPRSRTFQSQEHEPESPSPGKRPGPWPPRMEPLPPDHSSYNPRVMGTWARRSGFKSNMSGETASAVSDVEINIAEVGKRSMPKTLGTANPTTERDAQNDNLHSNGIMDRHKGNEPAGVLIESPRLASVPLFAGKNLADPEVVHITPFGPTKKETIKPFKETEVDMMSQSQDADDRILARHSHMKYDLTDTPGLVPLMLYGIQHYFSIAGSLVLIPLVIVPAMGGKDEETAKVISTMLLVSGITTLLHTYFGSRLPLIQGASFAYLAPALAIINSFDLSELPDNKRFRHIMRELQGAVIISSIFQVLVGYTGLMAWVLRVINPVVVAPTVAAVGLAFFSYGFPVLGRCVEIGIPQIMVVIFFALYLRKISIFGHSVFQIYAVPLGLGITWAYAFLLTETGAYDYNGCSLSTTGTALPGCEKHFFTMRYCRTDVSKALEEADWIRFPYPLQWGAPTFRLKTGLVMIAASVIASLDSVGSYHAASLLVASRAPPPGLVCRGIGLEGLTSALAGLWGTGAGATTLTENVHTIAVTKMGSRRAVEFGALVLIVLSFIGKIGALVASIPQVIAAALLCVMWSMLAALGLSNLRYSETGSSRNVIIVGLSLFLSLSIPAYFQQYNDTTKQSVPPYFQQYIVASHGPVQTKNHVVNFVLNTVLSFHMVVALLVAFILDNTVPGSRQERGIYVWSDAKTARGDPATMKEYGLPFGLGKFFSWLHWLGM